MKKLSFLVALLTMCAVTFAQTELFNAKLKKDEVPTAVVASLEKDFPKQIVAGYFGVPADLVGDTWYWNVERGADDKDFDVYTIDLSTKDLKFYATYDKDGNLLNKKEEIIDKALPVNIRTAIGEEFPGYAVVGDKMMLLRINQKNRLYITAWNWRKTIKR